LILTFILKFKIPRSVNNRVTATSNLRGQIKKAMKTQILAEPVLVGRENEIEELQRYLDLAVQGKGKTVFISGEAGSGKTRLTREFLKRARERGVAVMAGWCLSDSAAPFFPFVEAFNDYFEDIDAEEQSASLQQPSASFGLPKETQMLSGERGITAWLSGPVAPQKAGRPEVSPQVWKDQVFAGVAKTLHSISLQVPVILFIEDIHWADSASLALLQYVARAVKDSQRVLVLVTFRSEELTADAEGHPHPLTDILRMMRREDLFTEVKLSSLSQDSVSTIAENMLGGALQPKLAEKLAAESRGNPLFVVESLRMLSERKNLVQENNEWRLAVDELGVPSKIKDIILRRLSVLKYAQRRVLDVASVIGEKFDVELLSSVLGQDSLEVLEILNVIAHSTSLVGVEGSFYRFDHARSRETLYEELSLPLKKGYHARVAEKLERTSRGGKLSFSDLAFHFAQASNTEKAVEYSLAAGQDALARWSNPEAIKHFSYVLQNISETAENAETRRTSQEGLGDAYYASGRYTEAGKIFVALARSESGKVRLRAYRKAIDSAINQGEIPYVIEELAKEAEKYAASDRLEGARVLFCKAKAEFFSGDLKASLKTSEGALRVFEEEYSLDDAARILYHIAAAYIDTEGLQEKSISLILRTVALTIELEDFTRQLEALQLEGVSFFLCGLFEEATNTNLDLLKMLEKIGGQFRHRAPASFFVVQDLERRELFADALSQSLKTMEWSKNSANIGLVKSYSLLVIQYARLGDLENAEENFKKLMNFPPEVLATPILGIAFSVALSGAVFFAAKNQWIEANQGFEKAFEELRRSGQSTGWDVLLRQHYSWALERQGRLEEAKVQLEEVQRIYRDVEERFGHVSLQASLMVRREFRVGEEFEMRLDLVNASRKPGLLIKIEGVISSEAFKVAALPPWCSLQNGSIEMKNREIGAFQVETAKLALQAVKAGTFTLNPKAVYIDELGETKTSNLNLATITVQPAQPTIHVLPGRVSSGFDELDELLGGGIPENYAVVLASSSSDERSLLIKRFIESGAEAGETTFYLTANAGNAKGLAEKYQSNFYLFLCNPRADTMIQSLPNVVKIKGVENLTEIDIAVTKAFRTLSPAAIGPRRACIEIVSDVLLQHHAVVTRKWLSGLLSDLKAKGFTTLAVIDPQMHPQEEVQAITGLFEGEIRVYEKETANGAEKVLRIRKLDNQKYVKNELILTTEKLGESK
jgi:KaiC/GvpD/RAD55 family RecA-like ATPase/tetratricopeptide (TPR) repeat protein